MICVYLRDLRFLRVWSTLCFSLCALCLCGLALTDDLEEGFFGTVGRAYEGPGEDLQPECGSCRFQLGELLRAPVPHHLDLLGRRPQVLADGHNLATRVTEIREHLDDIVPYIQCGLTNGLVEGLGNKTRLATRQAYGFHSAQAVLAMIMLCCSGIHLSPVAIRLLC